MCHAVLIYGKTVLEAIFDFVFHNISVFIWFKCSKEDMIINVVDAYLYKNFLQPTPDVELVFIYTLNI